MKKLKNLFAIALVAVMAMTLNSCVEDDPYYWDIVGVWQLDENQYGVVPDYQVVKYKFNHDGSGSYGYYDNGGYWASVPILWNADGRTLEVTYTNGNRELYYYRTDGAGNLILSDSPGFYKWELFIPTY